MKLFIKLRNKYFTAFMSLALLIMASIGLFNMASPNSVYASMVKFEGEKSISITNGSFSSFSSSSSYPYTLSGYTNSGNNTPSMKTGAINISDSVYAKNYQKYGLTEYGNPKGTGTDNYVLMINTKEDSNYTYTSNEFTLSANGYYYVTVSAKTIGDNSLASVFLMKDDAIFEDCIIQNITSVGWSDYTFFVATNSYEDVKLKFGMQIGSPNTRASGCVLFDELHAGQISYERFVDAVQTFPDTHKVAEFRTPNVYKEYNFDKQIIEFVDAEGNVIKDFDGELNPTIVSKNYFDSNTSGGGVTPPEYVNGAINISTDDSYVIYKGQEEVLQPNTTYKFAINVKASEVKSGSAFVKLEEIVDESEDYDDFMDSELAEITAKSSNLTVSSATSNTVTDGYVEYAIYVHTGALETSKVQFSFGVGSEDANATANVSFKRFYIERVPYSAYSNASTGSTIGKIDIADRISQTSSEYSNNRFDKMESSSFDGVAYPATPTSWTSSKSGAGYQLSGVVNLSSFDRVMDKYEDEVNAIATPASLTSTLNNNVLMIYNGAKSSQTYTSSSKSLTANKHYRITTFVNTHLWDATSNGVTIVAKTGETVLAKADGVKTEGEWQRVVLNITAPSNSLSVSLELSLGYKNKLSSGYAFFDNILVEEADNADGFSHRHDAFTIAGSHTVDLNNPMLNTDLTTYGYYSPVLFTGKNNSENTINSGIVDLTKEDDLKAVIASSKIESLTSIPGDNKSALAISTVLNEDSYYQYTSVLKYNFESGKYYKFAFSLFTDNISQEDKENKYDNNKLAQGANLELTGLENAKFTYLVSQGEWTNYEFYIGVNSTATSNLVFSLGNEKMGCYGSAFLGNINLTEITEDEFKASGNSDTSLKVDTVVVEDEDDTETTTSDSSNNFSWAYIPTIATFAAIVIAVIGVFVRRNIKFKKRVGNKRANYDRDITVVQNKYRRLASDRRDKEIRELNKECNELIALRAEYEDKYKEALNRLRSAKLANRDGSKRNEIMAIEREVKHISKEVARYGVQVNNYENEIEFMHTEGYLIDLEKRMMREDEIARHQLRKEADMPEEKRLEAIAKREQKQAKVEQKAKAKAEKLASKQAKLAEEREAVQKQLEQAKAMDEQYIQQQELIRIKVEEAKLAKEQAKADKELKKLEKQKLEQERERKQLEQEIEKAKQNEETEVEEENSTEEAVDLEQNQDVETVSENDEQQPVVEASETSIEEQTESVAQTDEEPVAEVEQPVEVEETVKTEDVKPEETTTTDENN